MKFDLLSPERLIAALICLASTGVNRAVKNTSLAFSVPILGLPARLFIIIVTEISCVECNTV